MLCDSRDDSLFKHLFNTETRHTQNIKWNWGFFLFKKKWERNNYQYISSSYMIKMEGYQAIDFPLNPCIYQ